MKEKSLLILAVLVLAATPAFAGGPVDVLVESDFGSAGSPTPIAEMTSSSTPGPIGFALTITTRVWHDDVTGIYTYVYEFTDNGSSLIGISSVTIDTSFFESTLDWGDVGNSIAASVDFNASFGANLTFGFSSALPSGGTYTVYAQSTNPQKEYFFWGMGFGPSGVGTTLGADPPTVFASVPEVSSFLFLSTGLLGIGFFRRKFSY